uniref:Uncharacterized protein n=1 Tax=Arundo donax TaxID=35708 RepID=A0A0A8ZVI6_ARUDO
MLLWLLHLDRC